MSLIKSCYRISMFAIEFTGQERGKKALNRKNRSFVPFSTAPFLGGFLAIGLVLGVLPENFPIYLPGGG